MTTWTKFMQALYLGTITFGTYIALRAMEIEGVDVAAACTILIAATAWGTHSRAIRARDGADR